MDTRQQGFLAWLRALLRRLGLGGESTDEPAWERYTTQAAQRRQETVTPLESPLTVGDRWLVDEEPPFVVGALTQHAYALRDDFMSRAEASFFHVLRAVTTEQLLIFPKVRLADLVYAPRQEAQYAAFQRINRKHVDFVLCHPQTLRPVVALELDDRSHRRTDRAERDAFVDRIFAEARLPLLRVPVQYAYQTQALAQLIAGAVPSYAAAMRRATVPAAAATFADSPVVQPDGVRTCEWCGGVMEQRVATQGKYAGRPFWGCTNYPRCRNIVVA